mmetsp:Transcript_10975/g.36409  ORF Transcript_10975/g.36409 Transcript_10975/m.36409 type:complete len:255 (-) Transcript_10975:392-1156(-)
MGRGWPCRSMNSARESRGWRISAGVEVEKNAASRDAASDARDWESISAQHARKATWKSRLATGEYICATGAQARRAGAGDSRSSWTERRRIQSIQSSGSPHWRVQYTPLQRRSCLTANFCGRDGGGSSEGAAPLCAVLRWLLSATCSPPSAAAHRLSYAGQVRRRSRKQADTEGACTRHRRPSRQTRHSNSACTSSSAARSVRSTLSSRGVMRRAGRGSHADRRCREAKVSRRRWEPAGASESRESIGGTSRHA